MWCRKYQENRLKKRYQIAKLPKPGHRCEICRRPCKVPNIDHNHRTGRTRGILCTACNTRLGHLERRQTWYLVAISYLTKYSTPKGHQNV